MLPALERLKFTKKRGKGVCTANVVGTIEKVASLVFESSWMFGVF